MIIKIVLICGIIAAAGLLARGVGPRHLAWRRLALAGFVLVASASIVQPNAWSAIARRLGVGRGADLLLYALIVAFLSYVASRFARDRRYQADLARLARQIALAQAPPHRLTKQHRGVFDSDEPEQ
jgi:hypothetical protein